MFPECLKIAEVKPLFKAGSKTMTSNYRPISLLPPLSKIFEKCISLRLIKFLDTHKVLYANQFGFKANCSTENAVVNLCEDIAAKFNSNEITCSIFLDLRKAFDTINHKILLQKLEIYGIRGLAHKMLESYLSNRLQYCMVNGTKSSKKRITCGVPQGSVLGPLLFLIYINDISLVSNFRINLFADDSCLSLSNKSAKKLENDVNLELTNIDHWLRLNKLSLNTDKTSYLIFTNRKITHRFEVKVGDVVLKQQTTVKYLGVILDQRMTWAPHIQSLQKRVASAVWALYQLKKVASQRTLRTVYHALIHSKLQYCISSWGAAAPSNLIKLTSLQKRAIRTICRAHYLAHTSGLFKRQKILKLEDLYRLSVAVVVSRYKHGRFVPRY